MAEITKELGRIPVVRGEYQTGVTYYKDNIVQYKKSSYQVTATSITNTPPITGVDTLNPGWALFAGSLDAQATVDAVKAQETASLNAIEAKKVEGVNAVNAKKQEILAESDASEVSYSNTDSGLSATNVQDAVDELAETTTELASKVGEIEEDVEAIESSVERISSNYAKKDGYYDSMSVGYAHELIPRGETTSQEFTYQQSGGEVEITDGEAEMMSIKGNTLVFNQLLKNDSLDDWEGTTANCTYNNGELTINGVLDNSPTIWKNSLYLIENHKYISICCIKGNAVYAYSCLHNNLWLFRNGCTDNYVTNANFFTADSKPYSFQLRALLTDKKNDVDTASFKDVQLIDLTQMFGSGNEPTTLAEFEARKPIVEDEYAYNEGELISFNGSAVKSVGRNLWDEQWELGGISSTDGTNIAQTTTIRSKNYIQVFGSSKLCFRKTSGVAVRVAYYDVEKKFIQLDSPIKTSNEYQEFTLTQEVCYIRFFYYSTTYKNDICINISDTSFNGTYEPHVTSTRSIADAMANFSDGLKSAGSAYDEITPTKAIKRIGKVDLGSLNWMYNTSSNSSEPFFYTSIVDKKPRNSSSIIGIACERYNSINPHYASSDKGDKSISELINASIKNVNVVDSSYTDAATFKASLNGVILYYELETPVETTYDEKVMTYDVWQGGTEEVVADGDTAPIKASTIYGVDAYATIISNRERIKALEQQIAALVSASSTSTTE